MLTLQGGRCFLSVVKAFLMIYYFFLFCWVLNDFNLRIHFNEFPFLFSHLVLKFTKDL